MFDCKRCGCVFKRKDYLLSHLNRKRFCQALINNINKEDLIKNILIIKQELTFGYQCNYCNKYFNSSQGKYQHKRNCKQNPVNEIFFEHINLVKIVNKQQILLDDLQKKIEVKSLTYNKNIIVNLKDFGHENMKALPNDFIGNLFMNCKFRELLENLHCDCNFPENHNIKIKSIKRNVIEIYRNNRWELVTFVNGLNELLLQGHKIFLDYYKKNKEKILDEDMSDKDLKELLDKLDNIEKLNKKEIEFLHIELQLMLEMHRVHELLS